MHLDEYRSVTALHHLPLLKQSHPKARELLESRHCCDVAEASDTLRLFHLLQRSEYEPLLAVLHEEEGPQGQSVSVYFARLDDPRWQALRQLNLLPGSDDLSAPEQRYSESMDPLPRDSLPVTS